MMPAPVGSGLANHFATTPGQNLDNAVAKWFASPEPTGASITSSVSGPA